MTAGPSARRQRPPDPPAGRGRTLVRLLLGGVLAFAGTTHLTVAREEFQAQVPSWVPLDPDVVVVASGVVEVALGGALLAAPRRWRPLVGGAAAAFFVAIFPGNVAQYLEGTDGFGLDTDAKRLARLPFQVPLVVGSLWSTGAWRAWRSRRERP
ncbi:MULTISPECIES: MauE/DoxX family redox-associated membrane protein [Cellulomonas]|uniref:MauE/DoxX family redox-associated membrane protein n=1 Tax=Cellulomonas TaxID=1707 RepID=UPI0010A7A3DE|nr:MULTISPECIES: MauE/DoxX family redox-associated membrane protein [Cellulomonas]